MRSLPHTHACTHAGLERLLPSLGQSLVDVSRGTTGTVLPAQLALLKARADGLEAELAAARDAAKALQVGGE